MDGVIWPSKLRDFIDFALWQKHDQCIIWPFAVRKSSGYGAYSTRESGKRKNNDVHRFVCSKAHGEPPTEEFEAAHRCGNKLCINKRHLYWATPLENMNDAKVHGTLKGGGVYRQRIFAGERAEIQASKESYSVIAGRFGIDAAYVGKLRRQPLQFDL